LGTVLHAATTDFVNGIANVWINGSSGTAITTTQVNFFVTVDVGTHTLNNTSTKGHDFWLEMSGFGAFTFTPQTAGAAITNDYSGLTSNRTTILDESAAIVSPISLIPKIWADPFGDGYPGLNGVGTAAARTYDSGGVPNLDFDGDGINDIIQDAATKRWGVDLDGDGLIEIDMNKDGLIDVDFNNDGVPDCVLPDANGDGIPEIDLSCDDSPEFGYIPEKWSKETSRIFAKWAPITSPSLMNFEVGVGLNNVSNSVTEAFGVEGWIEGTKENNYQFSNLTLLAAKVTRLTQTLEIGSNAPFDLRVADVSAFSEATSGEIVVGSEIMGFDHVDESGKTFHIVRRGEYYGTPRHRHFSGDKVTNDAYVVRARARTGTGVSGVGAETAIKVYRVDVTPPTIPGKPVSDQEKAGGVPAENGVFSISWDPAGDVESNVRAYEIEERKDNDPVWTSIRIVPNKGGNTFLVGNDDNPSNPPREEGHFFSYRVRAINQAGGVSAWSPASEPASTGFPEEAISEVVNYPNPVDTRKEPTNIAYILNEDSAVKITLFDLLGYQIRVWNFEAGQEGGKAGPNVFKWDGTDQGGVHVAAGGYIMRIEVIGAKGSTVVIRKIGIIN
jgi:hypothetical protein